MSEKASQSVTTGPRKPQLHRRLRGQAMIEFIVACLAIIPLFLLVPLIGKYMDIKQSSIAASRKLAFECTVRFEDCADLNANPAFADEIRMRYFSGNRQEVLSNDRPVDDEVGAGLGNSLWVDRRGRPLLERYSDVGIRADARDLDVSGAVTGLSSVIGPSRFGLALERGVFDARVQVALSRSSGEESFLEQLDSIALEMQFHTAILTDAWTARGPGARGTRCTSAGGTVVGRSSRPSICNEDPVTAAAELIYLPASEVVIPLAGLLESNTSRFNFHDFMDEGFVETVPISDSVGFPRLQ
jgi:hypothetical protein